MNNSSRRSVLLKMVNDLEQESAEAAAQLCELQEGTPDYEAASNQLARATAELHRVSKQLAVISGEQA